MTSKNKQPQTVFTFLNEIKRRKVLRSLAIYAGTAIIILEAATIIFPRWGLPDWTIDLVLWILILGAFINVFISWIYDFTPDGIQRTKPLEEAYEIHDPNLPYLTTKLSSFQPLYDNPRFIAVVENMGLTIPER